MNRHYERYLVQKYQPLYQDRYAPMNQTAMCWGFEVGNGWFNIINVLSNQLCRTWLETKKRYDNVVGREGELLVPGYEESPWNKVVTAEMIEGLGESLKIAAANTPVAVQVKEKFGGLRFYVNSASTEQYAAIRLAESLSVRTCEVCGRPGKQNRDGWIVTRCKEHM